MPAKKKKLVFDMTSGKLNLMLQSTLDKVLKARANQDLPLVYRNNLCVKENQFIHQYGSGKKFLIQQYLFFVSPILARKSIRLLPHQ